MARRKPAGDDGAVTYDAETGEPLLIAGPPGAEAPDTQATRKTEDMYWSLLGNDKEGTGYVTVHYLANGKAGAEVLCLKVDADKYPKDDLLDVIRRQYAPKLHANAEGDYRIRLYVHTGKQFVKRGEELVSLLADAGSVSAVPTVPGSSGETAAMMREFLNRMDATNREMIALIRENKANDWREKIEPWMPVLVPITTALAAGLTARLTAPPPKSDAMQMLQTAFQLAGVAKDLQADNAPPVREDDPWYAPAVVKALEAVPHVLSSLGNRQMALGAPTAPGAPSAPVGNPNHPFYGQLVAILNVAGQSDPDEVAGIVFGNVQGLPEPIRSEAIGFLTGPDAFAGLAGIHPGVLKFPGFFADVLDALSELAGAPIEGTATDVHTPGTEAGTGVASNGGQSNGSGHP